MKRPETRLGLLQLLYDALLIRSDELDIPLAIILERDGIWIRDPVGRTFRIGVEMGLKLPDQVAESIAAIERGEVE